MLVCSSCIFSLIILPSRPLTVTNQRFGSIINRELPIFKNCPCGCAVYLFYFDLYVRPQLSDSLVNVVSKLKEFLISSKLFSVSYIYFTMVLTVKLLNALLRRLVTLKIEFNQYHVTTIVCSYLFNTFLLCSYSISFG